VTSVNKFNINISIILIYIFVQLLTEMKLHHGIDVEQELRVGLERIADKIAQSLRIQKKA
jgi:hypothetical protein